MNNLLILFGKMISSFSKILNLGHGSTWPGHIALSLNKNFIKDTIKKNPQLKIILIAGTNGKTTTAKLVQTILEADKKRVFRNLSGANLLNGIASTIIIHSNIVTKIKEDYAIFEVDENSLPLVLNELTPSYLILLNLFRDQLDRYGEVNSIANKWNLAVKNLPETTTLILNADDPQIAWLGLYSSSESRFNRDESRSTEKDSSRQARTIYYFGINEKLKIPQHASDSTYCPKCSTKLSYKSISFSHLGDWHCSNCKNKRPDLSISSLSNYPLPGTYNKYNTLTAVLLARVNNINNEIIKQSLKTFKPAFGRQEVLNIQGKKVQIFLSKNPTSFNQSLRTIVEQRAKHLLIVLNDRIPDGRDVSWIWDVDFEEYLSEKMNVYVSGDRCFDIALRLKYIQKSLNTKYLILNTEPELSKAVHLALKYTPEKDTLYILPTYSAMLEIRKILTGKKIL